MPSMMRRIRTRLPTYLSTGLGALVDISKHSWDSAPGMRQNGSGVCLRRRYRQILLGGSGRNADNLSNELTGSCFWLRAVECELRGRSVNWWIGASSAFPERRQQPAMCKPQAFRLANRRRKTSSNAAATITAAGISLKARINRRRQSRWQIGIQYAFDAETEPCDNTSRRIDDGRNAGIGGANERQAFFDGAHLRLLQMLVGAGRIFRTSRHWSG